MREERTKNCLSSEQARARGLAFAGSMDSPHSNRKAEYVCVMLEVYECVRIGGRGGSLLVASVFSREQEAVSSSVSEDKEEALEI